MATRQRTWMILFRPYYGKDEKIMFYTNVPKAGAKSDLGMDSQYDVATTLKGNKEGMEEWNTMPIDGGGWVAYYTTTSPERLKEVYRECINKYGQQYTRVVEVLPFDIAITPFA